MRAPQYTPVRTKRGELVHAVPIGAGTQSGHSAFCPAAGPFVVADAVVDCVGCLQAIVNRAKGR